MEFITNPWAAEQNAARQMRDALGFADAAVTQATGDGGIDVTSRAAVAQVKREAKATGRPDLQNLYGARGPRDTRALLFFSAAGYSKQATEYAEDVGMALFTYAVDGVLKAENVAAKDLISRGPTKARVSGPPRSGQTKVSLSGSAQPSTRPVPQRKEGPRRTSAQWLRWVALAAVLGGAWWFHESNTVLFWVVALPAALMFIPNWLDHQKSKRRR